MNNQMADPDTVTLYQEYWIPAGELNEFNQHIVGLIEITAEFHG